jgi:hypothetical protein
MKLRIVIVCFLLLWTGLEQASAQKNIWQTLSKVEWYMKFSKVYNAEVEFPIFSREVKALAGKEIIVKGYILPMDTEDGSIVLSALPWQNCFFCGGSGIETVMTVFLKKKRRFHMDEVTLKGILELNDGEEGLIYILRNASEHVEDF